MAVNSVDPLFKGHSQYLLERGINGGLREKLQIISCGPTKLKELGFKYPEQWNPQSAILIPSNNMKGEVTGCGARVFYQKSFGEDSRAKYLSLPGTGTNPPHLHFSPLASWDKLEYGQRIFITESYIKANIVCKAGFHAIGVSGCNGWSFKHQLNWQISDIDWRGRGLRPVVFMDSNVRDDRADLWLSVKKLQAAMDSVCGVHVEIIFLPQPEDGGDWGCDDYVMKYGEQALIKLLEGDTEPVPSELGAHLLQMNTEVVYIHEVGKIADIERNVLMGRGQFEDMAFATRKAYDQGEDKPTPVAKVWTKWDKRSEVDSIKYKPGCERLVHTESESYFNLWRGWGCEPIEGDVSFFTDWLNDAFAVESERKFFTQWWAYQLQHPGTKLNTSMMLVGPSGVGKGWMAALAERIFGFDNTWKCSLSKLESNFNAGLGAAQLLTIEEADVAGGVKVYNVLKDLITNEHMHYERKGVDAVKIDNCLNIFLNSNHIAVLELDEFDRRFAVLEITNHSIANDSEYWHPRWNWIREDGASAVFHWLLEQDCSDFDPYGEAPWTAAKGDMIESTHHPMDTWVSEHVLGGEEIRVEGVKVDGSLMSARELAWCYAEGRVPLHEIDRKQSMAMVKALNNARARVANHGKKIKYQGTPLKYYWVGKAGSEVYYQDQLDDRLFWKRLVASQANEVANKSDGGNLESSKKY